MNLEKSLLYKTVGSGVIVGAIFPLVANILKDKPDLLFYIICTAPLVLGIYSYLIARTTSKVDQLSLYLTEMKKLAQQLEDAQTISQLGNWSYLPKSENYFWSSQLYKIFNLGTTNGPLTFSQLESTIHPDDLFIWKESLQKGLHTGESTILRIRLINKNAPLWLEARVQAQRDDSKTIIGLYGTFQNITDSVLQEEALRLEKLKSIHNSKLATLGEMSAGIVHEINNPLTIIFGNLEIIKSQANLNEKITQKIDSSIRASEKIVKIVDGLRKFSRISNESDMFEKDFEEILSEVMPLAETKAKRHDTSISISIESKEKIFCNPIEIEQVIINLINNGIDAVKENDERWIKISVTSTFESVILRIMDSGQGITPELEQKIFQPFFTTKPIGEGTGLGLSISKNILDKYLIPIKINRDFPNTCFELRFPIQKGQKLAS